jgi:hypothetical protein
MALLVFSLNRTTDYYFHDDLYLIGQSLHTIRALKYKHERVYVALHFSLLKISFPALAIINQSLRSFPYENTKYNTPKIAVTGLTRLRFRKVPASNPELEANYAE